MRDSALQFLTGVLGVDGARALARTAAREPALEPLLVPRTALAWLQDRPNYEGLIPGQRNSYISFQKSEDGYAGVVSLAETNYEFLAATPEHVAAAVALAVGLDPALRHPVRDLTLTRLGKSIDVLARAHELAKALPGALSSHEIPPEIHRQAGTVAAAKLAAMPEKERGRLANQLGFTGERWLNQADPYSFGLMDRKSMTWANPQMVQGYTQARDQHLHDWLHQKHLSDYRAHQAQPTQKTELPGRTHQPTAQQEPEGPEAPVATQPQQQKPKLPKAPKMPGLRVGKSEQDNGCPSCGGTQFAGNVFRGCVCFRDLAKHVRTTVYGDGVVLEFGSGFPAPALRLLRKALLP